MKIIHITVGKVNPSGENGINRVVYNLNKYEKEKGVNSQIWAFSDDVSSEKAFVRDSYVTVTLFPFISLSSIHNAIVEKIKNEKNSIDIVHFHVPWIKEKYIISKLLIRLGVPYVVTLHGLYDKTLMQSYKKKIAFILYERKILNKASMIRAITYEEKYNARMIGIRSPIIVSQNGIDDAEIPCSRSNTFFDEMPYVNKIKFIWVGVLREYKNIEGLIECTRYLSEDIKKTIQFVIVGPDPDGWTERYKYQCNALNCLEMFDFIGPLYGKSKYDAIESSDIYIMPSKTDVVSLAVMDAMACQKPCIITRQCHVSYFAKYDFFDMCEPFPEDIARSITYMIANKSRWSEMGSNARKLIDNYFSWSMSIESLVDNYRRIVNETRSIS